MQFSLSLQNTSMILNGIVEENKNMLMALNETVVEQEGQMEQITTYFLSIQVRNCILSEEI